MTEAKNAIDAFLNAEEDHGFGLRELLPKGEYPVEIEEIQGIDANKDSGNVSVRLQLRVLDGPMKERRAFVRQNLVNIFDMDRVGDKFYNMSATFIRSIGAKLYAVDSAGYQTEGDACIAAYDPMSWKGLQFIAEVEIETEARQIKQAKKRGVEIDESKVTDRNVLAGWHSWTGARGVEHWRSKVLPMQIRKAGSASELTKNPGAVRF